MSNETTVLIVDDSAVVRQALTTQLNAQASIRVVGSAPDPYVARELIVKLKPDVITLDLEMPRMDGLTFLRKLMRHHPIPTIVVSSLTPKGCETAIACLEAGAIEVLSKPSEAYSVGDLGRELAALIRDAKGLKPRPIVSKADIPKPKSLTLTRTTNKVVAIGASTGGTDAISRVLAGLPKLTPGVVIVQHMPPGFTASFAQRLDERSELDVSEATDGDIVGTGRVLIAPGDRHMQLVRDGATYRVRVTGGPRVCRHRPSVEVLFDSVASIAHQNAIGVLMTGMGDDGAAGLQRLRDAGATTLVQDEKSCVVFGMPGAALKLEPAHSQVPLDDIASAIIDAVASTDPQTRIAS